MKKEERRTAIIELTKDHISNTWIIRIADHKELLATFERWVMKGADLENVGVEFTYHP